MGTVAEIVRVEALDDGIVDDPAEVHRYHLQLVTEADRLARLVDDLFTLARIERGELRLRPEPVDLGELADTTVAALEAFAQRRDLALTLSVDGDTTAVVDPHAIGRVLRNLLDIAPAAVCPGGGVSIVFAARRTDGTVELAVSDTGVGFRAADGARLFEKFTRLQPGGGSYHGTGLGLYIVRRLMHLMGGRVSAESAGAGQGSRFVLVWPAAPAEPA